MSKTTQSVVAMIAVTLAVVSTSACGGGGGIPSNAVAQVGDTVITKSGLSEWMTSLAGGDFYEVAHITPTAGLISDPPNYTACVADLKALVPTLPRGTFRTKCQQLNEAVKQQAMTYLLSAQQRINENAELGVTVRQSEVEQRFARFKAEQFPAKAQFQQYLAARNWSPKVEQFLLKRNLLAVKFLSALKKRFHSEQAIANFLHSARRRWAAKTNCRTGYIVEQCKQFKRQNAPATPAPAILIEEIAHALLVAHPPTLAADLNCRNTHKGEGLRQHLVCQPVKNPEP